MESKKEYICLKCLVQDCLGEGHIKDDFLCLSPLPQKLILKMVYLIFFSFPFIIALWQLAKEKCLWHHLTL